MKLFNFNAILLALLLTSILSFSQSNSINQTLFGHQLSDANIKFIDHSGVIRCGSVEYEQYLKALHPKRATIEDFESWIAPKIQEFKAQRSNSTSTLTTIPVIYHILTDGAGSENLSVSAIQAQNDQLNLDFSNNSGSSYSVAVDTEVRFILANKNAQGVALANPGVNRITDYGEGPFSDLDLQNSIKPETQWDPTIYLNIWVAKLEDGLLGYAQFPSNSNLPGLDTDEGAANTDGVVVLASSVGSLVNPNSLGDVYGSGRTLTHEVGHWLGLRHIWGDTANCTNDDFCADTPDASDFNSGCPVTDSCPDSLGNDMVENYMDYTIDSCMDTFTADQKARIQTVLANSPRRIELGAGDYFLDTQVFLYPNPVTDLLRINLVGFSSFPENYTVYNMLGRVLFEQPIKTTNDLIVNTSDLSKGVYFIKITANKNSTSLPFIKN